MVGNPAILRRDEHAHSAGHARPFEARESFTEREHGRDSRRVEDAIRHPKYAL